MQKERTPELTYEGFLHHLFLRMLIEEPKQTMELFLAVKNFVSAYGTAEQKKIVEDNVSRVVQSLAA
jgi:hypothetical protein